MWIFKMDLHGGANLPQSGACGWREWIFKHALAGDQRGPCSAYIASDSRVSDNRNCYDNSQKVFALKNTPDILGYCGETHYNKSIKLFSDGSGNWLSIPKKK